MAAAGAIAGAVVIAIAGERLRTWLLRRHGARSGQRRHGPIHLVWSRYGVPGLGLFAPLLVGTPLGMAFGITLGAPIGRLLRWMTVGIALWSGVLAFAGALGLAGIEALSH